MQLSEEQRNTVAQWVKDGAGLSEVQRRLSEEMGVSMTYMDVRFLIIDLGVNLKDKPEPAPKPELGEQPVGGDAADAAGPDLAQGDPAVGGVSVEVDRVMKPGSLVSGTVTFSDGRTASWALDQLGRLALDAGDPAYRPSPEDIQTFQEELRRALETRGF